MNYVKTMLSVLAVLSIFTLAEAKDDVVPMVHRNIHTQLQQLYDEDLAFRMLVDSVSNVNNVRDDEFELYPMLDLYANWSDAQGGPLWDNTTNIPATADIDVSSFVAPTLGRITSPFGWRRRRMHKGVDLKVYVGDTIYSAFDGKVRVRKYERRGYGYYYVIRHNNGLETVYGHLSRQLVPQDAVVKAGQPIGLGGNTGRSTGPHLHFEMRFMGIALDPADLIDFDAFKPKQAVYAFQRSQAEWAQANKGRRGAKYVEKKSQSKKGTTSSKNTTKSAKADSQNQESSKAVNATANNGNGSYHRVRQGDTLSGIARRYGTTVNKLCQLNGISENKVLQLDQKIRYK